VPPVQHQPTSRYTALRFAADHSDGLPAGALGRARLAGRHGAKRPFEFPIRSPGL